MKVRRGKGKYTLQRHTVNLMQGKGEARLNISALWAHRRNSVNHIYGDTL